MKHIVTYTTLSFMFCVAIALTAQHVRAAVVSNSITVQAVTGGQSVSGEDGKDGEDGEDGAPGRDGASAINNGSSFITTQSVINGETVVDTTRVLDASQTGVLEYSVSTSSGESAVRMTAAAGTGDLTKQQYEELQEIIATIQIILMSYVDTLF